MALITCPECGRKNVSSLATKCPDCGFPICSFAEFCKGKTDSAPSTVSTPNMSQSSQATDDKCKNDILRVACGSIFIFIAVFWLMNNWGDVESFIKDIKGYFDKIIQSPALAVNLIQYYLSYVLVGIGFFLRKKPLILIGVAIETACIIHYVLNLDLDIIARCCLAAAWVIFLAATCTKDNVSMIFSFCASAFFGIYVVVSVINGRYLWWAYDIAQLAGFAVSGFTYRKWHRYSIK